MAGVVDGSAVIASHGSAVIVHPDQVTMGVLVDVVPGNAVDEAVAVCG